MQWQKRGLIFSVNGEQPWMVSHAQVPVADLLNNGALRIYFGTRDAQNRTCTAFVDVDANEPSRLRRVGDRPVLSPGKLGTFDDSGAMPSCIVNAGNRKVMYYIGWNRGVTVRYYNAIGVAVSDDGGETFERLFEGPVMDRTRLEPYFVVTPFVTVEGDRWRMWYCGCTGWSVVDGVTEPRYQIKYAESRDGIAWERTNRVCIDYLTQTEANTRPCVVASNDGYRMWYCYRGIEGYRTNSAHSYRLGYAESTDGIAWKRCDELAALEPSTDGWDCEMIAYPFVYRFRDRWFMLYNGNGFGRSGFGYAVSEGRF